MANWYDFLVPNAVGDARKDIEPSISQYRGTNGRLDPNAVMPLVPDDEKPGAELALKIGEMRRSALDNYSKPAPLTWNQQLAGAIQEISVPVAYAQGNRSYAEYMMPNTILKKHQARTTAWEDESRKTALGINDETLSGIGNSALEYHKSVRARRQAAKEMVAKSIAAASARGPEAVAQATKMAAQYLRTMGLTQDADALDRRVSPSPVSGGPTSSPPGGAVSTPVPGVSVTQPQQSAGPMPQAQQPQQGPGGILSEMTPPGVAPSPKRQMAELIMPYNEDAAKALLKEAELEEAPGLEGAKEFAKQQASESVKLQVDRPNAEKALTTTIDTLGGVEETIDSLLEKNAESGLPTLTSGAASNVGGLYDSYFPNRPGSDASNAWAQMQKLKNNIGVMVLTAMREASKTGGAVGNVTEKEWPILQSQIAALDHTMSDEQFADSLQKIKDRIASMRLSAAQAFDRTYGASEAQRFSTPGASERVSTEAAAPQAPGADMSAVKAARAVPEGEPIPDDIASKLPGYVPGTTYMRNGSKVVPYRKPVFSRGGITYAR